MIVTSRGSQAMKSITALDARKKLGTLLDEVSQKGTHVVISRVNRPLAVLVPYEDYQQTRDLASRKKRLVLVAEKMDAWRTRHARSVKNLNTTEAIRQVRSTKRASGE